MPIQLEPWLVAYRALVQMEFNELRRYAQTLEAALEGERRKLEIESQTQTVTMTPEQRADFCDGMSDDFYRLGESFPNMLRYSLFGIVHSQLEYTLLHIANELHTVRNLTLAPSELGDKGITRAKTYLKKIAGVPFPDQTADWDDIVALSEIRNIIIHGAGSFPDDHPKKAKINPLLKRWTDEIGIDNAGCFSFQAKFSERVINTYARFLDEVFVKLFVVTP